MPKLWNKKPIAVLQAEAVDVATQQLMTHGGVPLKRMLYAMSLMALGIGNIIGAGIFVLTGQAAAAHAGPAIGLSFVISAIPCAFAGMSVWFIAPAGAASSAFLMFGLPVETWERLALWLVVGLAIYFLYGVAHS